MDHIIRHELKMEHDGLALLLYLNQDQTEFAQELGTKEETAANWQILIQNYIKQNIPTIKVNTVKIMVGTFMVTSFVVGGNEVFAAIKTESAVKSEDSKYTIQPGDSLSVIAKKYSLTVEQLKKMNNLTGDVIFVGQVLNITPSVFSQTSASGTDYVVIAGDTLWKIANQFGTTINDLKNANNLQSDVLRIGQKLVIPDSPTNTAASTPISPTLTTAASGPTTVSVPTDIDTIYTVLAGDSLSVIAKRFNVSVDQLKGVNHLTTDIIRIGQKLTIPNAEPPSQQGVTPEKPTESAPTATPALPNPAQSEAPATPVPMLPPVLPSSSGTAGTTYTVSAGDSLSVIAKRFNVSVDQLKQVNQLPTDMIRIGQILTIPNAVKASSPAPVEPVRTVPTAPVPTEAPATTLPSLPSPTASGTTGTVFTYMVSAGDSLSVIAKRFNVSLDQLRQINHLTSDMVQIGQILTIPQSSPQTVPVTTAPAAPTQTAAPAPQEPYQVQLQDLGYIAAQASTNSTVENSVKAFQRDYGLAITGIADTATKEEIQHAVIKKDLVQDTLKYRGVPYLWGGTTTKGFDCSGFVYFMFNSHSVPIGRTTSGDLFKKGKPIQKSNLQPGDLVFFAVNTTGTISHVGFYLGNNNFISATNTKGIAVYSLDHSYWSQYYKGAKRVY